MLSAVLLAFSGCGPNVDLILRSDSVAEDEGDQDQAAVVDCEEPESAGIYVYICGAVREPGVYEMEAGSRAWELLDLAGGLTDEADEYSVNLARTLQDGEMIRILTTEETEAGLSAGDPASAAADPTGAAGVKVNINTAGAEELTTLNGIGKVKAEAIISYREEHGFFRSAEEIMEVDGIAEGTYEKIKDEITI